MPAKKFGSKADVRVIGTQLVGSTVAGMFTNGGGTFVFTRTKKGGGTVTDIGSAVAHGSTYTLTPADRGYVIGARPVTATATLTQGIEVPTVAPLAPTVTLTPAASNTVAALISRNADNGGDTFTGETVSVYRASDNKLLGTNTAQISTLAQGGGPFTTVPVANIPANVPVYAKVASNGQIYGAGPQSAQSNTVSATPPKNSGVTRISGPSAMAGSASFASGAGQTGTIYKIQAPAGATGCRISLHTGFQSCAGVKASVASTDIGAIDTWANAYAPQNNGVFSNKTSPDGNSANGFVKAKWNGQNQSRRTLPGDSVMPSSGYLVQDDTVTSDYIPLTPLRARDKATEQYFFLFRVTTIFASNREGVGILNGTIINGLNAQYSSSGGTDAIQYMTWNLASADAVDGAYTNPTSAPAQSGNAPNISIEWFYPPSIVPTTFYLVGDSITESFDWNRWAILRKSTPQRPLHYVNLGGSTTRTNSFLGSMFSAQQNMQKGDYVIMPIMSPNNYSPSTDYTVAMAVNVEWPRLKATAEYLKAAGVKLIWWVPINFGANPPNSTDNSTPHYALYNLVKPYALANGIAWCDINGDPQCDRSNWNGTTNTTGWISGTVGGAVGGTPGDYIHPSPGPGKNGYCRVLTETLTSLGF